jgi:hypothetical protein
MKKTMARLKQLTLGLTWRGDFTLVMSTSRIACHSWSRTWVYHIQALWPWRWLQMWCPNTWTTQIKKVMCPLCDKQLLFHLWSIWHDIQIPEWYRTWLVSSNKHISKSLTPVGRIGAYSLDFKMKVTFRHIFHYEINVTFGGISLKLRQMN